MRARGNPFKVKKQKIFERAKGFRGRAKNCYSIAVRRVHKALQYSYISRRLKKRDMRSLWIQRINAACQAHGLAYNKFMHGLVQHNVCLNRKVLSQLAIHEPHSFKALTQLSRETPAKRGLGDVLDLPLKGTNPHIVHRNVATAPK